MFESIDSSTDNHNTASSFPSEPSTSGSCLRVGCDNNNIDDDGINANKQGRPAKPTAAQTGQKDRREREREVKSYKTGSMTNFVSSFNGNAEKVEHSGEVVEQSADVDMIVPI